MKLLVTGAAGRIGSSFYASQAGGAIQFVLSDMSDKVLAMPTSAQDRAMVLDLDDADACRAACEGMDAVLHLGADPHPFAELASTLRNNVNATTHIFEAALESSVQRVVFASSVWAMKGYEGFYGVDSDRANKPTNLYGASKVYGEGWCAAFGHSAPGRAGIAIRIGAYDAPWLYEPTATEWDYAAYVSKRDMNQLLHLTLTTPFEGYTVVHGMSQNRRKILGIERTTDIFGYKPEDDGYLLMEQVRAKHAGS